MSDSPKEARSDRSSVSVTDGMVRIRTPEGTEHRITAERAWEWVSSRTFIDQLRKAAITLPVPFHLPPSG